MRSEQRSKLIFQYLVDCIEIRGEVPTQQTIARDLDLSVSTVRRYCKLLATDGRVSISGRSRLYHLPGRVAAEVSRDAMPSEVRRCPSCRRSNALARAVRGGKMLNLCRWWTHGCNYERPIDVSAG